MSACCTPGRACTGASTAVLPLPAVRRPATVETGRMAELPGSTFTMGDAFGEGYLADREGRCAR